MPRFPSSPLSGRTAARVILGAAAGLALLGAARIARPDDKPAETVGRIEGQAIAVKGPMSVEVAGSEVRTVLLSGSDVRVKSGQARIQLREGGSIAICGPAHLSLLKSGSALTVALEYGTIHARIEREPALIVYTPLIQAHPVAIGDAPLDTLVGLETTGAMCLQANSGAVRVEQQLTGQSVLVPQGGDVLMANGQIESLRAGGGRCRCELPLAKANPATEEKPAEVTRAATAEEAQAASATKTAKHPASSPDPPKAPAREEPVYKVLMPPLSFDASSPALPPEPSPAMILLVRTVRVRPTLIFRGHVEAAPIEIASAARETIHGSAPGPKPPAASAESSKPTVFSRVRSFLRRLWSTGS